MSVSHLISLLLPLCNISIYTITRNASNMYDLPRYFQLAWPAMPYCLKTLMMARNVHGIRGDVKVIGNGVRRQSSSQSDRVFQPSRDLHTPPRFETTVARAVKVRVTHCQCLPLMSVSDASQHNQRVKLTVRSDMEPLFWTEGLGLAWIFFTVLSPKTRLLHRRSSDSLLCLQLTVERGLSFKGDMQRFFTKLMKK